MNKGFIGAISFVLGGGLGFSVSYIIFKQKYAAKVREDSENYIHELNKLHGVELNTNKVNNEPEVKKKVISDDNNIMDYYKNETSEYTTVINDIDNIKEHPYIINPEEFGEFEDYSANFFTYYTDGVLVDMNNNVINLEDIENTIGFDFAGHIGDYADGLLHIRNDRLKSDYEIAESALPYYEKKESKKKSKSEETSPKIIIDD